MGELGEPVRHSPLHFCHHGGPKLVDPCPNLGLRGGAAQRLEDAVTGRVLCGWLVKHKTRPVHN
jgi:hypothetical protein